MASKYEKFLKDMERRKPEDGRYQAQVDAEKDRLRKAGFGDPEVLGRRWRRVRGIKDRLELREKKINLALEATKQLMTETFEAKGITSVKFAEGGSVSTQPEVYVSVRIPGLLEQLMEGGMEEKDAKEAVSAAKHAKMREWCKENGHENDLTLNASTMASLFKEMLLEGLPLPEFIHLTCDTTAKLYK